jgi:acyl-[acyl-carrier-protein] desaturase
MPSSPPRVDDRITRRGAAMEEVRRPHPVEGHCLDAETMGDLVGHFLKKADDYNWNRFSVFDGDSIQTDRLTEDQRGAVSFITFIEDHLPGYFAEYHRLFPVDSSPPLSQFIHNRELYRFTVRWAQEEDRHAHVLFLYQVRSGMASAEDLRRSLAVEGRKQFTLGDLQPVQAFTYTLLQEKATQLFYRQFASVLTEPVLQNILTHLARDEARHFAFFVKVVEAYIRECGEAVFPLIKDVVQDFRMPLVGTMRNYWRQILKIYDTVGGHDHTEAFEELVRLVQRTADGRTSAGADDLVNLVRVIREL